MKTHQKKFFLSILSLFCLSIFSIARHDRQNDTVAGSPSGQIKVGVNFVVTTPRGNLVEGDFSDEDIEVYENGIRQTIDNIIPPREGPLTIFLLIDYSKQSYIMSFYSQAEVWAGPIDFINSLRPEDYAAIAIYDRKIYTDPEDKKMGIFQDFTQDKDVLTSTLYTIMNAPPAWSESCVVDAIKTAVEMMEENSSLSPRSAIVLISTGLDTFSRYTYDDALKAVQNSGVTVYAMGIGEYLKTIMDQYLDSLDRIEFLMANNRLKSFAELSGGQAHFPKFIGAIPSVFRSINDQLRHMYRLEYFSSNTKNDGKLRKIKIEIKKTVTNDKGKTEKLIARHRKGYYAPKN